MEGRFEEGERLALQALAVGQRVDSHNATHYCGAQLFLLRREQGRLQELETAIKGFVEQYPTVAAWRCGLASLYSELGREAEARSAFERVAAHTFTDFPQDNSWLVNLSLLSEVCAFLGDTQRAATLYELLLPYAGHHIVVGQAIACLGSVSRHLGLLAATLARWQEAERHFTDALEVHHQIGAKPFVVRTLYEYAAMYLTRGRQGDGERARALLDQALPIAEELGMSGLVTHIQALQSRCPNIINSDNEATLDSATSQAQAGHNDSLRSHPASLSQSQPTANVFRREGEYWTLAYQGTACQLKDVKGLHYLAFLLRHPGTEFHAAELVTAVNSPQ